MALRMMLRLDLEAGSRYKRVPGREGKVLDVVHSSKLHILLIEAHLLRAIFTFYLINTSRKCETVTVKIAFYQFL